MGDQDKKDEPKVQADNTSIAVGGIHVDGNVGGNITIGHSGYSSDEVAVLITQIKSTFQPKPFDGRSPYKGLDVFEEDDAELFFGRERLVEDLVARVKDSRTVFVTGPSGSGKSSLVRAGLIHALKLGALKNSEHWLYETMKPTREPFTELARVASSFAGTLNAGEDIRTRGLSDATVLAQWCEIALKDGRDRRAVIFIDQFEEVFTQISREEERVALLNLLTHAARVTNGRITLLFSMRSDFVSNCATYPQLNALLNEQFLQIGAMQPDELVSAMAQPALRVGLRIDPDLIAQVINDMRGEPGALPLMQFTLKDLFDAQQAKGGLIALTLNDYLQHGGIRRSLERHADGAFAKLSENEQELARTIFSGLIEIGRGTQDTRRTALLDELIPGNKKEADVQSVVQKLADARLIITDEQAGKDTVTISHEKLIDAWPWLKKLVNENRDVIALQNEIADDAIEWEEHKRDASYLYSGARLFNTNEKMKTNQLVLSGTALEYIRVSQARHRRGRFALIGGIISSFVILVTAVIVFATLTEEAQKQADLAFARQLAAQSQSLNLDTGTTAIQSGILAVEAGRRGASWEADQALRRYLKNAGLPLLSLEHDREVDGVVFSPDSKYVISWSKDFTIHVWNASTGIEIAKMMHDDSVNSVVFSPNGRYVASGSADQTARVWDSTTGTEVARSTHADSVYSVAFSSDGRYVVSRSYDQDLRIWESVTGLAAANQTDFSIDSVFFGSDGTYLVSKSQNEDQVTSIWQVDTGKEVIQLNVDASSVALSPDGRLITTRTCDKVGLVESGLAGTCVNGVVRVWQVSTGKEVASMEHKSAVTSVTFSPDGELVASGSCDKEELTDAGPGLFSVERQVCVQATILIWEANTGKLLASVTGDVSMYSAAFSPDSKYLVKTESLAIRVWEARTGNEVANMPHDDYIYSVAFSTDGKYVVTGSIDQIARVWELSTGKQVARLAHDDSVNSVAFSPDDKYIVSGSADQTARIWEATGHNAADDMTHDDSITSVAFSPDGRFVVSGSADQTARVWEVSTGNEVAVLTHEGSVNSVAFSPNGKSILSGSSSRNLRTWEFGTWTEVARLRLQPFISFAPDNNNPIYSVAISSDGKLVVAGGCDNAFASGSCIGGGVHLWDVETGLVREFSTSQRVGNMVIDPHEAIRSVAFSPDGKYVVVGGGNSGVWEVSTGKQITRLTHEGSVNSVAFSPDGRYVISGSADQTARVWEVDTGKEVARLNHDGTVNSVAFSPDGRYVVTGSLDQNARVWEVSTGKEVARLNHDGSVNSVAFSPDGTYVVSGGADRRIQIWQWRLEDLIEAACQHLPRNFTPKEWEQYFPNQIYETTCS